MTDKRLTDSIDEFLITSPLPWWDWNVLKNIVKASPRKVEMLGYHHYDFADKGYQAFTDLLHPDDYERTMSSMRDLLEGKSSLYQTDYRILAADGTYHWYMDRGAVIKQLPDSSPEIIRGIVIDIGTNIKPISSRDQLVSLLRAAIPSDRTKEAMVIVCSSCLKIKSGKTWLTISQSLSEFISLQKSHGLCENCIRTLYPKIAKRLIAAGKLD